MDFCPSICNSLTMGSNMIKWALCLIFIFGLLSCSDQTNTQNELANIPVETSAASIFEIDPAAQDRIASLRKTARAVSVMNEHEKARAAFKDILDAVETTYPKDSYPVAMALNDYGFILNVIGATRDALPVHQRAFDMINTLASTTPYAQDRQWRIISNLAETELRLGNMARARDLYVQAYKIPITLPWALPENTTNGDRTLIIIERWRNQYKTDPEAMFAKTDYTADPVYQAEVFANQDKGRYMDFGANPAESVRVWKEISETMAKAYHPRSRLATSALGNYGAISYFSDAKELGLSATLAALKQKEKFGTEFWFDAQNLSRAQGAAASTLINMNRAAEAGPYVEGLRKTLLQTMKGDTIDMSLLHTLERDRAVALGDYALAVDATKKMIALNRANPQKMDDQIVSQLLGLAQVYLSAGDTVRAEKTARIAMQDELTKGDDRSRRLSEAQYIIGQSLTLQGRYFDADIMLRRAVKTQKRALGEDLTHTGPFLMALAGNLSAQGKHEAAIAMGAQAVNILVSVRGDTSLVTSSGLIKSAEIHLAAKQFKRAITIADKAVLALEENAQRIDALESAQMIKARALIGLGQDKEARSLLANVLEAKQNSGLTNSLSFWQSQILHFSLQANTSNAKTTLAQAWPLLDKFVQDNVRARSILEGANRDPKSSRQAFEQFLGMAVLANDPDKALSAAQYLVQTSASRTQTLATRRRALGDSVLAEMLKSEQSLQHRLSVLELSYVKMVNIDAGRAQAIQDEIANERFQLGQAQKMRKQKFPDVKFTSQFDEILTLKTLQKQLNTTEAILILAEGQDALYPLIVTKTAVAMSKSPMHVETLRTSVSRLHMSLNTGQTFDTALAHNVYNAVFTPEIKSVMTGISHINVITNGSLSSLPLAVLSRDKTTPDWLINYYSFTTLASVGAIQEKARSKSLATGFLGIGAPSLSLNNQKNSGTKSTNIHLSNLPELPNAKQELEALAKALPNLSPTILTEMQARQDDILSLDLSNYNIVAFATHGLVSGEIPELKEAALVLSSPLIPQNIDDSLLTASEISNLEFDADWIILSACNSASGSNRGAPGLTGLARSFINAGARALLVSHWTVRDDAAAYLSVRTINNAQSGLSKAQALQKAMLDLMVDENIPGSSHPAIWAPFVLVGN